jgi:ABC-type transport system involved in multi-copper enzyme maturation permease subunit
MTGLLRSELRKVFTTRLWWGLLIGVVLTSAGFAALGAALIGVSPSGQAPTGPGLDDPAVIRSVYAAGISFAYLFALSFGIISMSGEFRHQTMTATVLASPHRNRVVLAKLLAVFGIGLGYGVVTVLSGLLGGIPVILLRGGDLFLGSADTYRALVLGALAVALWAVLGLGVGTLIRNQVVALRVAIGIAWLAEPLIGFALNAADLGSIAQYLPTQATTALTSPPTSNGGFTTTLLPWWAGGLVLLGYAGVSGGLGAAITLRRDVT